MQKQKAIATAAASAGILVSSLGWHLKFFVEIDKAKEQDNTKKQEDNSPKNC